MDALFGRIWPAGAWPLAATGKGPGPQKSALRGALRHPRGKRSIDSPQPLCANSWVARFEHSFEVDASVAVVRAFHGGPSVLKKLTPPPVIVRVREMGELQEGMVADFTLWVGPIPIAWRAEHRDVSDRGFVDIQSRGPMKRWEHTHRFEPIADARTRVIDSIEYEYFPGLRGLGARLLFNSVALHGLFTFRAWATRRGVRKLSR